METFQVYEDKVEESQAYNVTACCEEANLNTVCFPLCSYDANMSDIKQLAGVCGPEFPKLIRCGAAGRNHNSCCARRGVSSSCIKLCAGVMTDSIIATATTCVPYIGNIVQCFEEGNTL